MYSCDCITLGFMFDALMRYTKTKIITRQEFMDQIKFKKNIDWFIEVDEVRIKIYNNTITRMVWIIRMRKWKTISHNVS